MKQHPIPQDITNYRFHLIGSMTLKQFGEVAGGAILALIVYSTNLINIVKWPLIILCVGFGAALAWVPIEERPLDHWIITFFKNLYKPTKFYWKKQNKVPDFFNYKANDPGSVSFAPDVDYTPARRSRIQEYLSSITPEEEGKDAWDQNRELQAQALMSNFDQVTVKAKNLSVEPQKETNKPKLKTRVRKLNALSKDQVVETVVKPVVNKEPELKLDQDLKTDTRKNELDLSQANQTPVEINLGRQNVEETPVIEEEIIESKPIIEEKAVEETVEPTVDKEEVAEIEDTSLEPPAIKIKAEKPNQLVGVVRANNKNLDGALVEVCKNSGQTLRIVKTDALGQFRINTALPDGDYLIKCEHQDHEFEPIALKLRGKIVPAIEIQANS